MTINKYFSNVLGVKSEQDLVQDLVDETISISGIDVFYCVRDHEVDPILIESFKASFPEARPIEVFFSDPMAYSSGQGDFLSKFGVVLDNGIDMIISRRRFAEEFSDVRLRPREGDLLYVGDPNATLGSIVNSFFEITYVDSDNPNWWQFGRYATFKLKTKRFTFSHEKFDTGYSGIDAVNAITDDNHIDNAINLALREKQLTLKDFTEENPFGDL